MTDQENLSSPSDSSGDAVPLPRPTSLGAGEPPTSPNPPGNSGGRKKLIWRLGLGLLVTGIFYAAAWPVLPKIKAEFVDNPMGKGFALGTIKRSKLAAWLAPNASAGDLCTLVKEWAVAQKETATCAASVTFTRGFMEKGKDRTDYLWGEMRGVKHGATTETLCFFSTNRGASWEVGTGLAMWGLFPIQTSSDSCIGFRKSKHALDKKSGYEEH